MESLILSICAGSEDFALLVRPTSSDTAACSTKDGHACRKNSIEGFACGLRPYSRPCTRLRVIRDQGPVLCNIGERIVCVLRYLLCLSRQ